MADRLILHYAPDNASLTVRLALEEMGLAYDLQLVDRTVAAQTRPGYLALNPAGKIPVLETPQGPIFETGAILLWLTEITGKMAPPPGGPDRGAFLKWLFFTASTLHGQMVVFFYPHRGVGPDRAHHDILWEHLSEEIKRHLLHLDSLAETRPGWFGGEAPSILDLYVAVCLRWLALYPVDMPRWFDIDVFPNLSRIAHALEHRASTERLVAAEGLGPHPFTAPVYPDPPEGSAL